MRQHSRYFYRECVILMIMGLFLISTINVISSGTDYEEWYSLDSPHNYPSKCDYTWKIRRSYATGINIRFHYIEIESGFDILYVRNIANQVVWHSETQHIGKVTYNDLWVYVSGEEARIQLTSDSSIEYYGFRIDRVKFDKGEWIQSPNYPNNYPNNYRHSWYVSTPSGNEIQLFFSELDIETYYDHLYIYDDDGNRVWSYTNPGHWPGTPQYNVLTPIFNAHILRIELVTDYSVTRHGFRVDNVYTSLGDDDDRLEVAVYGVAKYAAWWVGNLRTENADHFRDEAIDEGWWVVYDLRDSQVDDHHFYDEGDHVDLIFFSGHGSSNPAKVWLDGYRWFAQQSDSYWLLSDEHNVGRWDWEWAIFASCKVMASSDAKEMLYHGGHGIFGYRVSAHYREEIPERFWDYIRWDGAYNYDIGTAFAKASYYYGEPGVRGWFHGQNRYDHLWGQGKVYPDSSNNNDITYRDYN